MRVNIQDWLPISPLEGPPLPKFLGLTWPWYKATLTIPAPLPPLPETPITLPYPSPTPPPAPVPLTLITPELILAGISILSVNGIQFSGVGVRTFKYWFGDDEARPPKPLGQYPLVLPYATLAESVVKGVGLPLTIVWRNNGLLPSYDRLVFQWFVTYDYLNPGPLESYVKPHGWVGGNAYKVADFPAIGDVVNTQLGSSNIPQASRPNRSTVAYVQIRLFANDQKYRDWEFAIVNI